MKKGDRVTIDDTSYSRAIIDGELKHPGQPLRYYKEAVIVELNCTFPKTSRWKGNNVNDTIIQLCGTGQIIFIEERFLRPVPPKHKIMIDVTTDQGCFMYGNIVEISDKLYKEIKRNSQN